MKKSIRLVFICMILLIAGCASGNEGAKEKEIEKKTEDEAGSEEEDFRWAMEDLSLYNHFGDEELYLTEKTGKIKLSDGEGLKTYRNVKIGVNAKKALEKYDLKDFYFEFTRPFGESEVSFQNAEYLKEKYSGISAEKMLERISEIEPSYGVNFYYIVDIYELDSQLYTESTLPGNEYDNMYLVFFYIWNEGIDDVVVRHWNRSGTIKTR